MGAIKGPGLGEQNNELKDHVREAAKVIASLCSDLHSSAIFNGNRHHKGASFRNCSSQRCKDTVVYLAKLADLAPARNRYALVQWRARVRRIQQAIKSAPPE